MDYLQLKYTVLFLLQKLLAEAIYDYLSKNNKPIPEFLEKQHEKTVRENEMLEERYEEWTENQQD